MKLLLLLVLATCFAGGCVAEVAKKCSADSECNEGACDARLKVCFSLGDQEPPGLEVQAPTSGATVGVRFTITGTASDALSGVSSVEYSFDGNSWAALALSGNAFSQSVASPTAGTTSTLAVRATDRAGNVAAVSIPLNLDLVPPVLTLEPSPDSDCSGVEKCTGAVISLANSNGGTSFDFSGTVDDTSAALTIKIGSQAEVPVTRDASKNWHYTFAPVAGSGEVVVVATATGLVGNTASITRKVLVDVTPPTCQFAAKDAARLVERTGPLLSCTEAMALSGGRGALKVNNAEPPQDFYGDANNAYFYSRTAVLDGNTTFALV